MNPKADLITIDLIKGRLAKTAVASQSSLLRFTCLLVGINVSGEKTSLWQAECGASCVEQIPEMSRLNIDESKQRYMLSSLPC